VSSKVTMDVTTKGVPENLVGVWQRESIQINDELPYEDSRVLWLQTSYRYADMRVPNVDAQVDVVAFSGRQLWSEPLLTFNHELDYSGSFPQDAGVLSWDEETLVESGSVDVPNGKINYVERWRRCTSADVDDETWEVRTSDDVLQAIALKVADYAIVMANLSGFSAVLFEQGLSGWNQTTHIGNNVESYPPWELGPSSHETKLPWVCLTKGLCPS
jgi:hypothetical protein